MKPPLPAETRDYFGNDKNRLLKISNLGLLFNKYVYSWQDGWQMEEKNSKEFRDDISKIQCDKKYVLSVYNRQKAIIDGMQSSGWHVEYFNATTDSRLIIGLGGTSVIETGMTLHPLYGFPYLPGSGLKGVARAYAEIAEDFQDEETKKKLLHEIFGSDDKDPREAVEDNRQGKVFFMDGMPVTFPKLELDIMNPHYGDYYQDNKPPADYLNPVPVTFLTVAPEQKFSFTVISRNKGLAEKAKSWIMGGLTNLGAGGKTNVGYGYFKIDKPMDSDTVGKVLSTTQRPPVLETIIWNDARLTWSPGNQTLKAEKDGRKAELKITDKNIVPANLHKKLFDKREAVKANVTVEQEGNYFKIVKISSLSS